MQKTKKKNKWKFLTRFLLKIALFTAFVWASFTFVFGWVRVSDSNMFPMVKPGDFCLYLRMDEVFINDPVVYENAKGKTVLGRVAAIEGQTVDFPKEGGYTVDGTVPSEYLPYETVKAEKSTVKYPVVLGGDEYFILNDFRQNTKDSREEGKIASGALKGKILFIFRRRSI